MFHFLSKFEKFHNEQMPYTGLLFILFSTAWIYWPGLNGPLILDDIPHLQRLLPLESGEVSWWKIFSESATSLNERPVAMLSFVVNFLLTGSDIWYLKLTNLAIHLFCGFLIFCFSQRLLLQPVTGVDQHARNWIALWITAAWLLAPLQVSTTLYVIQRMTQLSTMFVLTGLLFYVIGRQEIHTHRHTGLGLIAIAFGLFWPLATFSKQNGIIFPLLVFIVELFFFKNKKENPVMEKQILITLMALISIPLIVAGTKIFIHPEWILQGYSQRDFSFYERVITQPRILFDYVANMLLIPGGSGMGLFHDDFRKSTGLLSPVTAIISISALLLIVITGLLKIGTRSGLILFGPVFYIAAHLIESSIFPLELYFEHRNYLPGFGIFFSMGICFYYLISLVRIKKIIVLLFSLIPVCYAGFASYRVDIWQSWDSILLASEHKHPDSKRVQAGLAIVYIFRGDLAKATEHLEIADRLDNRKSTSSIALEYIIAYCYAGRAAPESVYERLEKLDTFNNDYLTRSAILWFVESVEQGKCTSVDLNRVINILHKHFSTPQRERAYQDNWEFYIFNSRLMAYQGKWAEAVHYLDKALRLNPDSGYAKSLKEKYQLKTEEALQAAPK